MKPREPQNCTVPCLPGVAEIRIPYFTSLVIQSLSLQVSKNARGVSPANEGSLQQILLLIEQMKLPCNERAISAGPLAYTVLE